MDTLAVSPTRKRCRLSRHGHGRVSRVPSLSGALDSHRGGTSGSSASVGRSRCCCRGRKRCTGSARGARAGGWRGEGADAASACGQACAQKAATAAAATTTTTAGRTPATKAAAANPTADSPSEGSKAAEPCAWACGVTASAARALAALAALALGSRRASCVPVDSVHADPGRLGASWARKPLVAAVQRVLWERLKLHVDSTCVRREPSSQSYHDAACQ